MSRPNKPRKVYAEEHLARWIATERAARGLTMEALAQQMTDAGCPIHPSAIYKIERGKPRRKVTIDEWIVLSQILDLDPKDLLTDPDIANERQIAVLLDERRARLFHLQGVLDGVAKDIEDIEGRVRTLASNSGLSEDAIEKYWDREGGGSILEVVRYWQNLGPLGRLLAGVHREEDD